MKLVYIAGKFSGPTRDDVEANIIAAVRVGIEVARIGGFPVTPHANTAHPEFEKVQPYPFWIEGTKMLLQACDAVMLVHNWRESSGARGEVLDALAEDIPVFDSLTQLSLWLGGYPAASYDGELVHVGAA